MEFLTYLLETPPPQMPIGEQINLNTVLIAIVGAIVTLVTPYVTARVIAASRMQDRLDDEAKAKIARDLRQEEREQDRLDRAAVADAVKQVAVSRKEDSAVLEHIVTTGDATHAIVNNQRTQMLRQIAVLARAAALDHPDDVVIQEAARAAEEDLRKNLEENADPKTKLDSVQKVGIVARAESLAPLKVQVTPKEAT